MITIVPVIGAAYLLCWMAWRMHLPFTDFPFLWVYFWSSLLLNVVGSLWLADEGWLTTRYLLALVILLAGFVCTCFLTYLYRGGLALRWSHQIQLERDNWFAIVVLLGLSGGIIGVWIALNGPPVLFNVGSGLGRLDLIALRTTAQFAEDSNFHWFRPAFYVLPVVVAVFFFVRWRVVRSRMAVVLFGLTFAYAMLAGVAFLNKTPTVVLFTAIFLAHVVMTRRVRWLRWGLTASAVFGLVVLLYIAYDPEFVSRARWYVAILDRIFIAYARSGAIAFSEWPDALPFFQGRTIVNPGGLLPYQSVSLGAIIYPLAYHVGSEMGNAPAPAFAEGWVNFGWPGVFQFVGIAMGTVLVAQAVFARIRPTPLALGVMAILLFDFAAMAMNSTFYTVLEPARLVFYMIIIAMTKIRLDLLGAGDAGRRRSYPPVSPQVERLRFESE